MARAHATHNAGCNSLARRCSGALLLMVMVSMLSACGGGGGSTSSATGQNTAVLAWDAVTHPSLIGYRIYYGTAPGNYLQPVGKGLNVAYLTTTYSVTGLSSGTRYYFAVAAYDMDNESIYSNEVFKDVP